MAFGIDDIAAYAAAEIAEVVESAEAVSEEMLAQEFETSNFESELSENSQSSQFENIGNNFGVKKWASNTEQEFLPENFSNTGTDVNLKFTDSESASDVDESITNENYTFEAEVSEEVIQIKTINSGLEGQQHPVTGVNFERKIVTNEVGEKVEGVFPQFESKFDAQLPENLQLSSDSEQFAECNRQLKEKYDNDPTFREQFDERQRENIENGETPYGYTWHHSEEIGKMQLVDYDPHQKTAHTGGRTVWGGGSEFR